MTSTSATVAGNGHLKLVGHRRRVSLVPLRDAGFERMQDTCPRRAALRAAQQAWYAGPPQHNCITGKDDPLWLRMMIGDAIRENPKWFIPNETAKTKAKPADLPLSAKVIRVTEIPEDDGESVNVNEDAEVSPFPVPERFSDVGNAKRLIAKYGDGIRYVRGIGWIVWDGKRWQRDADSQIHRLSQKTAETFFLDGALAKAKTEQTAILRHWLKSEGSGSLANMRREAQPLAEIAPDLLDADPWLFNCANGTIDLRTGALRVHRREDFITKISPVAYNAQAHAPRWERFLKEVFAPHLDVIPYLQKLVGYAMTGSTNEKVFPILFGPTSNNGKSTLLRAIRRVMGDYGTDANAATLMQRHSNSAESPTPGLLELAGHRFVYVSETQSGHQLNEALIKNMTGDDVIVGRGMYERKQAHITPTFKVFFATNNLPKVSWDAAYASRVKPIPFGVCFLGKEDGKLEDTLKDESEGILLWALEGTRQWLNSKEGLREIPPSVRALLREYETEMDSLANFVSSRLEIDLALVATAADVFAAYRSWCMDTDAPPLEQKLFSMELKKRIHFTTGHIKSGTVRVYKGVGLKGAKPAKPSNMSQEAYDALWG